MQQQSERQAIETAQALRARHGDGALMQAHVLAYEAVLEKNIPKCSMWRRVIELLETQPTR